MISVLPGCCAAAWQHADHSQIFLDRLLIRLL